MPKKKIVLPRVYTQEVWERHKNPHNKKYIGLPYISWSQIESFNDKKGFNTGLLGEYEYVLSYFLGIKFPDMGWGDFGSEAEAYITVRDVDIETLDESDREYVTAAKQNFTAKEKKTLEKVKTLGVFQEEICYFVEELNVIVLGYIDDRSFEVENKIKMLRDYKTKSESSKKDLHLDKKHQIELYILGLKQRGLEVENAEYCIIERLGGAACFKGGGRESLYVGEKVWYEPYSWDEDRLKVTHKMIVDTVIRVADLYNTFNKYLNN